MEERIKRISEMEKILDECRETLTELEQALDHLQELQDGMGQLFEYYGSEEWYEDRELELPPDVRAGVLSEDLIYDAIMDTRDLSFRMLETATEILKNKV